MLEIIKRLIMLVLFIPIFIAMILIFIKKIGKIFNFISKY